MDENDFKKHPRHKAAQVTILVIFWSTVFLFGLQLCHLGAVGVPLMSWWWVFSPIWISAILFVVGIIVIVLFFMHENKHF